MKENFHNLITEEPERFASNILRSAGVGFQECYHGSLLTPEFSTQEFAPTADPDDFKRMWNMRVDSKKLWELHGTNDISQIRGDDGTPLYSDFFWKIIDRTPESQNLVYRWSVFYYAFELNQNGKLDLPGMQKGKPSDAVLKAFAKVPMKVLSPNAEFDLPFDMEELRSLIEKEQDSHLH